MHNETDTFNKFDVNKTTEQVTCTNLNNDEKDIKIQKCKFCSSTFENLNEYLSHIEMIHKTNRNSCFMCSVCGKQYKTKNELTHHINSKCGTVKQFKCKVSNRFKWTPTGCNIENFYF